MNDSDAYALRVAGDWSSDHVSAWRLPYGVFGWCLGDGGERWRVRPATRKSWTARAGCTASGAGGAASYGASRRAASHGASRRAAGDGTTGRACVSSTAGAATTGHGATSDAALRRTAAASGGPARRNTTARISSCCTATSRHGAAADAAYRNALAPERPGVERAAVATRADRTAGATA